MAGYGGRVALVTGAASGIGKAVAQALLEAGATVIATDIADFGADTATRLVTQRHDVSSEGAWQETIGQVIANQGRLDLLVNCAGILESGGLDTATPDALMRSFDINSKGTYIGCREAIAVMKTQKHDAAIVNIASANAVKAQSWTAVYAASKAAVLSLTRTSALHCAENGYPIRVNAILPGIVRTPMVERLLALAPDPAAALKQIESYHPIGRLLEPSEIASVVLFLGSAAASAITGAGISVDGGMTAF